MCKQTNNANHSGKQLVKGLSFPEEYYYTAYAGRVGVCMIEYMTTKKAQHTHPFYEDYESFYNAYYGLVLGYLKNRTSSYADAEDVAAKVFLYCYEKWESYDSCKASQQTWLFMIVRSRWIDFLRSSRSHDDIDELDEYLILGDEPLDNAIRLQAIRQELTKALKSLPENQRTAIIMRYFGDYTDSEIARRLNTSEGNIRVLIHRGINKLKLNKEIAELL